MNKNRLIVLATFIVISLFVVLITGCNKAANQDQRNKPISSGQINPSQNNLKTFTPQELNNYDGKMGRPAYVAVNGLVYDVSNNSTWKSGIHKGYKAGTDLTNEIKNAPHGLSVLQRLPVVGKLAP